MSEPGAKESKVIQSILSDEKSAPRTTWSDHADSTSWSDHADSTGKADDREDSFDDGEDSQ